MSPEPALVDSNALVYRVLATNVRRIYTYNLAHFQQFPEIEVLIP